ncbi:hypothetical protein [Methylobacillus sp.]|uniref:hypothetical protein n=1 Tax=Methylobacillus sp. TaxID=56818 RepID=UPI002FE41D60
MSDTKPGPTGQTSPPTEVNGIKQPGNVKGFYCLEKGEPGLFHVTTPIRLNAGRGDCDGPRPRFLPAPLINARAAVMNRLYCQDLSQTARQVLYGVLAFFKLGHPEQPVFAFRDTLQAETLLSSRSKLFRGLQEAEDKGYIRREQVRNWGRRSYGQFSRSHIYVLDKTLLMLGLAGSRILSTSPASTQASSIEDEQHTEVGVPPSSSAEFDALPSSVDSLSSAAGLLEIDASLETCEAQHQAEILEAWEDGRADWEDDETGWEADTPPREPTTVTPYATYPQEPCLTVTHGIQESEPTLDLQLKGQLPTRESLPDPSSLKDSSENIDPHTRLPHDVTPLMKLGVSKTLICTLMAHAKRQGQQGALGAAVKLFWQHIHGLRGRSVFAYLRKVLSQKRDYAYLLKQQYANEIDGVLTASATARLSEKLAVLLARGDGFQVRNAEGQSIGTLRANGETGYVEGFDPKRGRVALPANLRFMQAVEEGRLHLRPC